VHWLGWPLFAAVLLALASGGLVSARGAVTACSGGCGIAELPDSLAAWNLWLPNTALPAGAGAALRRGLLSMHAAWGVLVVVALALAAWRLRRQAGAAALAAGLALAAAILGLGAVQQPTPLPAAAAHSLVAGLTLAAAAMLWRGGVRSGRRS